jgi:hypothetical protein
LYESPIRPESPNHTYGNGVSREESAQKLPRSGLLNSIAWQNGVQGVIRPDGLNEALGLLTQGPTMIEQGSEESL